MVQQPQPNENRGDQGNSPGTNPPGGGGSGPDCGAGNNVGSGNNSSGGNSLPGVNPNSNSANQGPDNKGAGEALKGASFPKRTREKVRETTFPRFPGVKEIEYSTGEVTVSFYGVEIPKGQGGPRVPKLPDRLKWTETDAIGLRDVAIAFKLKHAALIPGGVGVGKTTRLKIFCNLLNREMYYVPCHQMDAGLLIGQAGPNDKDDSGPEVVWNPGIVLQALTNGGILVLDEYDQVPTHAQARLHEPLDALLSRDDTLSLIERAAEIIKIHPEAYFAALFNPPGPNNPDRNALAEAPASRFVTFYGDTELTEKRHLDRFVGRFSKKQLKKVNLPALYPVSYEDFEKLPGYGKYGEWYCRFFHKLLKSIEQKELGSSQGQPPFLTQRSDRRVEEYICEMYSGDLTETIRRALNYEFMNKFELEEDRKIVENMISQFSWVGEQPAWTRDGQRIPGNPDPSTGQAQPAPSPAESEDEDDSATPVAPVNPAPAAPQPQANQPQAPAPAQPAPASPGQAPVQVQQAAQPPAQSPPPTPPAAPKQAIEAAVSGEFAGWATMNDTAAAASIATVAKYGRDALPALFSNLCDDRALPARRTIQAVAEIAKSDLSAVWQMLHGSLNNAGTMDNRAKVSLARMVGQVGLPPSAAVAALRVLANDQYPCVRAAGIKELAAYGRGAVDALSDLTKLASDPSSLVRTAAVAAIKQIETAR